MSTDFDLIAWQADFLDAVMAELTDILVGAGLGPSAETRARVADAICALLTKQAEARKSRLACLEQAVLIASHRPDADPVKLAREFSDFVLAATGAEVVRAGYDEPVG